MLRSLTIDDATGNPIVIHDETGLRLASKVNGLFGVGSPRDSRRVLPQAHGSVDETKFEDGRFVTIEGSVMDPGDINGAIADFRAMVEPMIQTWDVGPALLKW